MLTNHCKGDTTFLGVYPSLQDHRSGLVLDGCKNVFNVFTQVLWYNLPVSTTNVNFPNQYQLGPRENVSVPKPNSNLGPSAIYPTVNVLTGQYPPPTVIPMGPRKKISGIEAVAVRRIEVAAATNVRWKSLRVRDFRY